MNIVPKKCESQIIEEKRTGPHGEPIIIKYTKGKFLGKGGFAKCYELINTQTNKILAAKIVSKESITKQRAKQKLMSEIKIHRSLRHSGIVGFESFFEDPTDVYIILELCSNQTLNELIKRRKKLTEIETQCFMQQLIRGLKYLQDHKIIHRDLKLGNLFLSEKMELKIGDFGLATRVDFEGERKRTICGTPNYIAPEILEGKNGHSYEVDIWSVGVILYTLLIGKPPFETSDVKTTYKKIKMNSYNFPDSSPISSAAKTLIQSILNSDPTKRPKLSDIASHSFFAANIPALLPNSCLACPPSSLFMRQYAPPSGRDSRCRLGENNQKPLPMTSRQVLTGNNNLMNTDRQKMPSTAALIKVENKPAHCCESLPEVYITKWVDYSSKYGLGYILSNGLTGVFFNDATKIIMKKDGSHFDYIEKKGADKQDTILTLSITEYPKEIQKKITLLQHFRSYLEGENSKSENYKSVSKQVDSLAYVKKWMRTKHAILFRLSNKVVQVNFLDLTQVILFSETKTIAYTNKKSERSVYPLNVALESNNPEMSKRLRYTKEILTHMMNSNSQKSQKDSQPSNEIVL